MANWHDKYDLVNDMCANCGRNCGAHGGVDGACPCTIGSGWSTISKFVLKTSNGKTMTYNVWYISGARWTDHRQDSNNPRPLTWAEAKNMADHLNIGLHAIDFVIRELLPGGQPGFEQANDPNLVPSAKQVMTAATKVSQTVRKVYTADCPCGIAASMCDYHRA